MFLRVLAAGGAGLGLMGHSPYRQWRVFRKLRLIIVTSRAEPGALELGEALASLLAAHLPASRALAARAPDAVEIVKLLGSDQLDVALLTPADARAALEGSGPFAEDGPVPLRALATLGSHLFVCREDFPAANAYQIAETLGVRWSELAPALIVSAAGPEPPRSPPVPVHPAALEYYQSHPRRAAADD